MDFEQCSEKSTHKIITVKESGRSFTLKNEASTVILKIKVDGCLIKNEEERCDYLFEIHEPCTLVYYLELKGKDIEKACSQLRNTIRLCQGRHKNIQRECYIVASRVPKETTKTQKFKVDLKKDKIGLHIKTNSAEIKLT